jgi:hypothetical protein
LGWTDLDQAFAAVCGRVRATPGTQVIYIGDGVITTGEASLLAQGGLYAALWRRQTGGFLAAQ